MNCCICDRKITKEENGWDRGHNAYPLMEGRCCVICNDSLVLQTRLKQAGYSTKRAGTIAKAYQTFIEDDAHAHLEGE